MIVSKLNENVQNIQKFKGSKIETKPSQKEVKDGKKKMALMLASMAVIAGAGVAIALKKEDYHG